MDPAHVSTSSKTLFNKARRIVPPLLERFHKGQQGRVAVIGGSLDYTGAPYFSSMASAKLGCDMVRRILLYPPVPYEANDNRRAMLFARDQPHQYSISPAFKLYDMLADLPSESVPDPSSIDVPSLAKPIISMLSRLHALVIGPGLGRDGVTLKVVTEVIKEAQAKSIPFVLDADGLLLVTEDPAIVKGYKECILTPNVNEFSRLAKAIGIEVQSQAELGAGSDKTGKASEACEKLSKALGGVTIIQKGPQDVISNGITSIVSDVEGGRKRSGGQGDTLTGSLGTLLAWRAAYHNGLWNSGEKDNDKPASTKQDVESELQTEGRRMSPVTTLLLAAWAGSGITRECSRRAFVSKGRSMQAEDLTEEVYPSFLDLIGEPDTGEKSSL